MTQVSDYEAARIARTNMVESQLRPNRVYSPEVMQAMLDLPREMFVPEIVRGVAYTDISLKIAPGRYLMEPLVLARLFDGLELRAGHSLLIVGAGTGYSAAIADRLGARITAVEEDGALFTALQRNMATLDLTGISLHHGKLTDGHPVPGGYDRILIDGGVQQVPQPLLRQLKDGGRLVAVVDEGASHITVFERADEVFSRRMTFDNVAPILPGFGKIQEFQLS